MRPFLATLAVLGVFVGLVRADGPGDNLADKVRPIPPPGIAVPEAVRNDLTTGVAALGEEIDGLRTTLKNKPALLGLLPDVQIFHKAVHSALKYNEFYKPTEFVVAKALLQTGHERAAALRDGKAPWTTATGLVVRGYLSKLDGSVQPYGLVVPGSYQPNTADSYRLDFWCHGRGETLTELDFINGRLKSPGEFTPPNAFVVHLYGRYCCANKLAGEIDLFETLADVRAHYPIDENRLVIRGFSMGGAACWHFAVHYPGLWAAAAPGAGFSETPDFLKVFQHEAVAPPAYERTLWHQYDCTDYALNLFNLPTVAYSGEVDTQKQAADVMAKALAAEGIELTHLIGPKTGHAYHPQTKQELIRRIDGIVSKGRNPIPKRVKFTTWALRYNEAFWVKVDGLDQHWRRARVDAELTDTGVVATTTNVSALSFSMPSGYCPLGVIGKPKVTLDGQEIEAAPVQSDRSWTAHFRKSGKNWAAVSSATPEGMWKVHGLQGPIDDAFLDSFLIVRPTGKPQHDQVGNWATAELTHAVEHWRNQFRGEARVKTDVEVGDSDLAEHNLILFGDPASNAVLGKLADKLSIKWNKDSIQVGGKQFPAATHVPLLIYPNPLNPKRYVVLNSGFTFREYDYLNNARQIPKLPDYAVIDVTTPRTSRGPGKVVEAGFFDEHWQLPGAAKE